MPCVPTPGRGGSPACRRLAAGRLPADCRGRRFAGPGRGGRVSAVSEPAEKTAEPDPRRRTRSATSWATGSTGRPAPRRSASPSARSVSSSRSTSSPRWCRAPGTGQQVPAGLVDGGEIVKGVPGLLHRAPRRRATPTTRSSPGCSPPTRRCPGRPIDALRENRGVGGQAPRAGDGAVGPWAQSRPSQRLRWVAARARSASTTRAYDVTGAASSASRRPGSARRCASPPAAAAPEALDDALEPRDLLGRQRRARARRRARPRPRAEQRGSASATRTVRLPSSRSSPAGLPVTDGVAEDAEQVVAQLEGLARGAGRSGEQRLDDLGRRRRPARRRRAAAARRSTSPTCSAPPAWPWSTSAVARGPAARRRGTARARPRCGWRRRPAAPRRRTSAGRPQPRSSSSAHDSSRSPSRTAAAAPYCSGRPGQPGAAVELARRRRWVAGWPRRVSEASMKSSCTSAEACSSSSAARGAQQGGSSPGVGVATAR